MQVNKNASCGCGREQVVKVVVVVVLAMVVVAMVVVAVVVVASRS